MTPITLQIRLGTCFAVAITSLTACATDDHAASGSTPANESPAPAESPAAPPAKFLPTEAKPLAPPTPHSFTATDLVGLERVGGPVVSPDGKSAVFVRRTLDSDAMKYVSTLWRVDLASAELAQLTFDPKGGGDPSFSPDGTTVFFLSSRSGSSQLWSMPLAGGPASQVTSLPLEINAYQWSADGRRVLIAVDAFADCATLACTKERLDERAASKETGKAYDRVFVRHWDSWKDGRRGQLFVADLGSGEAKTLEPIADATRVTVELDADVPPKPWWGAEAFTFTPEGDGVVFVAKDAALGLEPTSTNFDLWRSPLDGSAAPTRLTENAAWDDHPVFSPDGKTLAYVAMQRPGFEADKMTIWLKPWPDGKAKPLTAAWDRSVDELLWTPDGKTLLVTAYHLGQKTLFAVDVATGAVREVVKGGHVTSVSIAGERLLFRRNDLATPDELFTAGLDGSDVKALTNINEAKLRNVARGAFEQFSFKGAKGDTVYGWIVKPAGFDETKRYPLAFLIHGGPQGSFSNRFHHRWNPQTYAGAGYAVVTVDFHGSVGYGQKFTDSITGDWGGKPLEDLQKGLKAALDGRPWIDGERACALGASYGGYMINWIAGKWPERFRCLVNHDGIFDNRSMYYATEELWFPEWEHGGPYYKAQAGHERHNPAAHVERWKTPMLVVHGQRDHRVPLEQGLQTFNALQRRGVRSRLLYFPDENHWVLKPSNSLQWHREVEAWLDEHTANSASGAVGLR